MRLGTPKQPIEITSKNIIKYLKAAKKVLDKQGVPPKGHKAWYWNGKNIVELNMDGINDILFKNPK